MELTCHGIGIHSLLWIVEPYIPTFNPIIYVPGQIAPGSYPVYSRGSFVASLTSIVRDSGNIQVADLVSRLSVTTSGVGNGTRVMCWTYRGNVPSKAFTTLYFAS